MIVKIDEFQSIFLNNGFSITEEMYNDFSIYASLLVEYNKKMNLTAIVDAQGITIKHFLDSVLLLKYADIKNNASIIDVGTGAGFPGIPLKIYNSEFDITLLDSLNKRIGFLNTVSEKLNLNIKCIHSRAEDGGINPMLREMFDVATARAVAPMPVLSEYCIPFVKVGGCFFAMKGPNEDIKAAKKAIKELGGELSDVVEYSLSNGDVRTLVTINKVKSTPMKYPRNAGQIKKISI